MFNIKSLTNRQPHTKKASPPAPLQGERKKKPHPQPLSKGRGEVVSLEGAIVRTGLTDKICEICEICGTKWRGKKPHPRPLSKGRGEVVSLEDAIGRTGLYRQNL